MEVVESQGYTSNVQNAGTIQEILEPYSKPEIIEFITNAAIKNPDLYRLIQSTAKEDVAHRQIFVYGLGWDTTPADLRSTFHPFGEIEDCILVTDRATGKAKGYAFVLFKTRRGAANALKQPKKKISNRLTTCQLASLGSSSSYTGNDPSGRKIYVSSVQYDVDPGRLRAFFEKFGEIEEGPLGFDFQTGKSRGFALFLYKTQDGATKALAEPCKIFEGHQLHCRLAIDAKNKLPMQTPLSSSLNSAQNLLMGAYTGLNPLYGGLTANQTQALLAANQTQALLAANQTQALLAANQNQALMAANQVSDQSKSLLAANQNHPLLAANQNPALQAANQSQALLPSNHSHAFLAANHSQSLHAPASLNPLTVSGGYNAQNMLSPNKLASHTGDMGSTSIGSGMGLTRYGAAGSLYPDSQHSYLNVQKHVYPYSQGSYQNGQLGRSTSGGGQGASGYFSAYPTYTWYG